MMWNPFAINNGDLDGGDARERRENDERHGIVKSGRAGGVAIEREHGERGSST